MLAIKEIVARHDSFIRSIRSSPKPEECVSIDFDFSSMACRPPCFRALALFLLLRFAEGSLCVSCPVGLVASGLASCRYAAEGKGQDPGLFVPLTPDLFVVIWVLVDRRQTRHFEMSSFDATPCMVWTLFLDFD